MDEPSVIAEPLLDTAVVEDTQSNGHFPIPPEQMGATGMRFSARLVTFFTFSSRLKQTPGGSEADPQEGRCGNTRLHP